MGVLENATVVGEAKGTSGAFVRMHVAISEENRVDDIRFEAYVCPTTRAAASILTEIAKGKNLTELQKLTAADLIDEMGDLPASKTFCAELSLSALRKALATRESPMS